MPKNIDISDFRKIDLRTAKVVSAERVEGSDKLLKLTLDLGGKERQIVAGIGLNYKLEQIQGKTIVVVANLEPKKIMGVESQGMMLAASTPEGPVFLSPEKDVPSGTKIF